MPAPALDAVEKLEGDKSAAVKQRNDMRNFADTWNNRDQAPTDTEVKEPDIKGEQAASTDVKVVGNEKVEEQKVEPVKPEVKKPLSFTKTKIQEAEEAKRVAAEAQKSLEQERLANEAKIKELESRIETTDSKKVTEELQGKIAELEKYRETVIAENEQLKKQNETELGFKSPVFQSKWVAPVAESFNAMSATVGNDPSLQAQIQKIRLASDAALNASTPEEKLQNESVLDDITNDLFEQLSPLKQARFKDLYYTFLSRNEQLQQAYQGGYETSKWVKDEAFRLNQEHQAKLKQQWNGSLEANLKTLTEQSGYSEEIANTIKLKGIDDSTDDDLAIANDLLQATGAFKFTPQDHTRVIAQGVNAKRLKAANEALTIQNAELMETVKKFQGTSTVGNISPNAASSSKNGIDETTGKSTDGKIRTQADFVGRWGSKR